MAELSALMTQAEFGRWLTYASKRALPTRRIELLLAQIAMLIARTMGGVTDTTIKDYLFDPPEQAVVDLDAARQFFGYRPRKKRKG